MGGADGDPVALDRVRAVAHLVYRRTPVPRVQGYGRPPCAGVRASQHRPAVEKRWCKRVYRTLIGFAKDRHMWSRQRGQDLGGVLPFAPPVGRAAHNGGW